MIKYIDPNIKRKSEIVKNSIDVIPETSIPLPSLVEMVTQGLAIDHSFVQGAILNI